MFKRITFILSVLMFASLFVSTATARMYRYGSSDTLDLTVKGGYFIVNGESELWAYNSEIFDFQPSDLNSFIGTVGVNIHPNNFLTLTFEAGGSFGWTLTQYRDFVDEYDMPIETDIQLSIVPIEASLKLNLLGRGRKVGRFGAREKNPVIPYIGGGVGMYIWNYTEFGDYIDFYNDEIIYAEFEQSSLSFGVFVLGGIEIPVGPRFGVIAEYKYLWLKGDLGEDFSGFDDFDLGGQIIYVGVTSSI